MPNDDLAILLHRTGAGLELVDLSVGAQLEELNGGIAAVRKRLKALGEPPLTLHGPFLDLNPISCDPLVAGISRIRYEQAYRAAQELGASKIVYHSCFVPATCFAEGWAERMAAFYHRFLEYRGNQIEVVMENVFDPSPHLLREVAERVDHPAFGLCLDIGHAHCYSCVPIEEWLTVLHPWIRHIHVHDNNGTLDDHLALGRGSIPFSRLIPLFPKQATLAVECPVTKDAFDTWKFLWEQGLG